MAASLEPTAPPCHDWLRWFTIVTEHVFDCGDFDRSYEVVNFRVVCSDPHGVGMD